LLSSLNCPHSALCGVTLTFPHFGFILVLQACECVLLDRFSRAVVLSDRCCHLRLLLCWFLGRRFVGIYGKIILFAM
jgi:hypothetical protein